MDGCQPGSVGHVAQVVHDRDTDMFEEISGVDVQCVMVLDFSREARFGIPDGTQTFNNVVQ